MYTEPTAPWVKLSSCGAIAIWSHTSRTLDTKLPVNSSPLLLHDAPSTDCNSSPSSVAVTKLNVPAKAVEPSHNAPLHPLLDVVLLHGLNAIDAPFAVNMLSVASRLVRLYTELPQAAVGKVRPMVVGGSGGGPHTSGV